jgi:Domain of unknown function (DUF4177)
VIPAAYHVTLWRLGSRGGLMPEYRTSLVGTVSDRWTKKGKEKEMEQLSRTITAQAAEGWRLHSLQPVPIFSGLTSKQTGVELLAIFESEASGNGER